MPSEAPLVAKDLAPLLERIADGTISNKIAKEIFTILWDEAIAGKGRSTIDAIIDQRGWRQINDTGELALLIDQVMTDNAKLLEDFQAGKEKAFNSLVGQIMKASKGTANPQQVNDLLRKKLT